MGFSSSPSDNTEFKYLQHKAILDAKEVIKEVDSSFKKAFGRNYGGLVDAYLCEDAEFYHDKPWQHHRNVQSGGG